MVTVTLMSRPIAAFDRAVGIGAVKEQVGAVVHVRHGECERACGCGDRDVGDGACVEDVADDLRVVRSTRGAAFEANSFTRADR